MIKVFDGSKFTIIFKANVVIISEKYQKQKNQQFLYIL